MWHPEMAHCGGGGKGAIENWNRGTRIEGRVALWIFLAILICNYKCYKLIDQFPHLIIIVIFVYLSILTIVLLCDCYVGQLYCIHCIFIFHIYILHLLTNYSFFCFMNFWRLSVPYPIYRQPSNCIVSCTMSCVCLAVPCHACA